MDKVLVAMSGGVDSGVAAYKLYERYACIAHKNGRYLLKKAAVLYDGDVVRGVGTISTVYTEG